MICAQAPFDRVPDLLDLALAIVAEDTGDLENEFSRFLS
jgi:hypothetical protein